jgi:glutathione-independent formaldehyde dehydrogenase
VEISSAAICGSDLHMYDGRTAVEPGKVLGHEIMGTIAELGGQVKGLSVGDRVVLPFNIACGTCMNCVRQLSSACLTVNPQGVGGAYGYALMGPFDGGQAQRVRVPFIAYNALKVPGKPRDKFEDHFLMLADVFPTAYHATEQANVQPGLSVAIFGAGPVGLLCAMSARIKGASEIYVIDTLKDRLKKARDIGAVPIDFADGDPVEQIHDLRKANRVAQDALRAGESKMEGIMCCIDAVGYQARDRADYAKEKPTQVIDDIARLVNPTGFVSLIGVYTKADPGAPDGARQRGQLMLPLGELWEKGVTVGMGQCPVKKYDRQLRDLVIAGKAEPGTIVTHHVDLEDVPEMYAKFDQRDRGVIKVVIHP